jgi:endo-alpha-1,4-polygalactosaminidase (GH114 family)
VDSNAYKDSLSPACREQLENYPSSTLHMSTEQYLRQLAVAQARGKMVFTVDYAVQPDNIARVVRTSRASGFVPFVGSRALDRYVPPQ